MSVKNRLIAESQTQKEMQAGDHNNTNKPVSIGSPVRVISEYKV